MTEQLLKLKIPTTKWYSEGEENAFFNWLYTLPGYVSCEGRGRILEIVFDLSQIKKETAIDLVAMFRRYFPEDIMQLADLKLSTVGDWFSSPGMYWHSTIFSGN